MSIYGRRPDWAEGSISWDDARFLRQRVAARKPNTIVEIGTASGVSTAVLADALSQVLDDWRLVTYDITSVYYADRSKAVGAAAREMLAPEMLDRVEFRNPDGTAAAAAREHADLGLVFIDANHLHPWPCLDTLAVLDSLAEGSELVLHDINLPARRAEEAPRGAQLLFNNLRAEKTLPAESSDPPVNIGSVKVRDREGLRHQVVTLVEAHAWEVEIPEESLAVLR